MNMLKSLFGGELKPCVNSADNDETCCARQLECEVEEELKKHLDAEGLKALDLYQDAFEERVYFERESAFRQGFQLAVSFFAEGLMNQ